MTTIQNKPQNLKNPNKTKTTRRSQKRIEGVLPVALVKGGFMIIREDLKRELKANYTQEWLGSWPICEDLKRELKVWMRLIGGLGISTLEDLKRELKDNCIVPWGVIKYSRRRSQKRIEGNSPILKVSTVWAMGGSQKRIEGSTAP